MRRNLPFFVFLSLFLPILFLGVANVSFGQTTIARWDFPNNPDNAVCDGGIAANSAKTITVTNSPQQVVSFSNDGVTTYCMSANKWDNGANTKNYSINDISTTNYSSILFSISMRAGNVNSPRDFKIQYRYNDGVWNDVGSAILLTTSWAAVATNLPLPLASDKTDIDIRILQTSNLDINNSSIGTGSGAWVGIDNILITGIQSPSISVFPSSLNFGAICQNTISGPQNFTITGTNLTTANVTVSALTGYTFSTTSGGTYSSSLNLTHSAGSYIQDIYVKFTPETSTSYNGSIVITGGGAFAVNVAISGTGLNSPPVIGSPTSTNVASISATLGGNITSTGCSNIIERGIFYSTINGFADGSGTKVSEPGSFSTGNFTILVSGLAPNTVYYYKAFAANNGGTVYTSQDSFTTPCEVAGSPSVFGDNQWNVYAYNGRSLDLNSIAYMGFYTETSVTFDSQSRWTDLSSPSSASGYQGCNVNVDNHTFVYKRRGFPCGTYQIDVPGHDDEARLYINGSSVWEHIGCCDAHTNVWTGLLDANSTVEFRVAEGGGNSYGALTFTGSTAPLSADFSSNTTTVLLNGSVNFTDSSTGPPTSYSWLFPGGTPSTSNSANPTVTYNSVGTYDVSLSVTNACGTDQLTRTGYITVTTSLPCSGPETIWSEDFPYSNGTTSGSILDGTPKWSVDNPANDTHFNVQNNLIEYQGNSGAQIGTWTSQSINISGFSSVSFSIGASTNNANHEASDYTDIYYSINGGGYTRVPNWNSTGDANHTLVNNFTLQTVTVSGLSGNSLRLQVRMLNSANDEYNRIDDIVVTGTQLAPTVNDPPDLVKCAGDAVSISFSGTATTYYWSNNNTSIGLAASGVGNILSFTSTNSGSTPLTATITVTPSNGICTGPSQTFSITVNPLQTVDVGGPVTAICQGGTTGALNGYFGGSASSAIWSDGGAGGSFTNNYGSTPNTATYTASATSVSPVTLTLTTNGGTCGTASASKQLLVNALPIQYSVIGGGSYCTGGTQVQVGLSGSEPGVNYQLYLGASQVGSSIAGTGSSFNFGGQSNAGTYTVIATRTNGGCTATMLGSSTVTINTTPSAPSIGAITQPTCTVSTGSVTLNNLPSGNWSLTRSPGGIITNGSGTSTTITGLTNGTYTFTVTGENSSASCPGSGNGLKAEYFDNINLSGSPVLEKIDQTVSFDWGGGGPGSPIANDYFSVRWTGKVQPCFTENYTFTTRSDDGIRLWVNGSPVIDNWTLHGSTYNSGSINLIAGQKYDIRLEFYENAGSAVAELYWNSASQANQIIPQTQLYYSETGCISSPSSAVIINMQPSIPSAPTGSSSQTFCSLNNPTVANLLATGSNVLWYDAASGGVSLQPSTGLIDGRHYYASQTVGGCESTSRFDVTATVVTSPVASISYSGTPYCASGTANATLTGQTGGTYSSTAGLSINSSNGTVDLSASTPGTYTVTYNFSNGTCSNTASTSLTINAFPTASISYSGTPYCGFGSASVTQTGQTGGTYSSTAGLSINSANGAINLSASTPGTYTVTYNFSNGSCSNTTSTNVTIFALPEPSFIVSPGSDDCAFDEVVYTTQSGMSNYVWNIPGILGSDYTIISGGTGPTDYTVALKWITDSMKTVTVNYSDGNGCTGIPATSTVNIHPIPSIGSFN